jgi:hypothetical protein
VDLQSLSTDVRSSQDEQAATSGRRSRSMFRFLRRRAMASTVGGLAVAGLGLASVAHSKTKLSRRHDD